MNGIRFHHFLRHRGLVSLPVPVSLGIATALAAFCRLGKAMDDKDRLLLSLLRRDARRPVVALARDLGLSRTATQDRLAKLQASGAIAGFTIVGGDERAREIAYLMVKLERGARCVKSPRRCE